MHKGKNFFEKILDTIMDIHVKTKKNIKSRMDVVDSDREELNLQMRPKVGSSN